jgi:hypothetical protein
MELFSILGVVIFAILVFFLSRVLSVVVRILFFGLIVTLFLVFFLGISLNSVLDWITAVALLVV